MSHSASPSCPVPRHGQRKRPAQLCANPLFLHWMETLLDEAHAKRRQTRWNYAKAVKALRRFPLVMKQPVECALLEGFGKGTCDILTDKLLAFAKERGFVEKPGASVLSEEVLEEALRIGNSEAAEKMLLRRHQRRQKHNHSATQSRVDADQVS